MKKTPQYTRTLARTQKIAITLEERMAVLEELLAKEGCDLEPWTKRPGRGSATYETHCVRCRRYVGLDMLADTPRHFGVWLPLGTCAQVKAENDYWHSPVE